MYLDQDGRIRLDNPDGEEVTLTDGQRVIAKECRQCGHIFQVTDGLDNGFCSYHRPQP